MKGIGEEGRWGPWEVVRCGGCGWGRFGSSFVFCNKWFIPVCVVPCVS